ncbi:hypothetical protein JTE90_009096 [Oedothorax gibbosus]|uniref:Uncharacterized protein n=1 Tax=Oedothorax gibbosus TaxID=931172 RepID=A0AAV6UZQ4_9ARAC|nr:hypothetical protein JTE90_009096 [Oedothorax gibbosus]
MVFSQNDDSRNLKSSFRRFYYTLSSPAAPLKTSTKQTEAKTVDMRINLKSLLPYRGTKEKKVLGLCLPGFRVVLNAAVVYARGIYLPKVAFE